MRHLYVVKAKGRSFIVNKKDMIFENMDRL